MKLALAGLMALALVGCGTEVFDKEEVAEYCNTYTTKDACVGDDLCKWKDADADSAPRCKAK